MAYKKYQIIYAERVIESLDAIYDYIANTIGSKDRARRKIASIREDIKRLEIFPEAGFDADKKFGKRLDPNYPTRGITLRRDYLVLYNILDNKVRVVYLLPTKSDYMKLFK